MLDGLCTFRCACCGEENETFVDISAGKSQAYVEDCTVCCRPNMLKVSIDEESGDLAIEAEFEG